MIKKVTLENYGPIDHFRFDKFDKINLLIGTNGTGKTTFLKALYSAVKSIELFERGKNIKKINDILFDKLYWTFQTEKIGSIVKRPDTGALKFEMEEKDGGKFSYSFSQSTEKQIVTVSNTCKKRTTNSVFLPAKEILSLIELIIKSRDEQEFGFDDTYYDLARALRPTTMGKNIKAFAKMRKSLENSIGGHIEFDKVQKKWFFIKERQKFDLSLTSEGTKKIAILDTLLGNHYLSKDSIIFIDEPEAGLHPDRLIQLLEIVVTLAEAGLQFFIASHSYFVIKKLFLISQSKGMSIPVLSFDEYGNVTINNLKEDMPDNTIIDQSIALYKEEMSL